MAEPRFDQDDTVFRTESHVCESPAGTRLGQPALDDRRALAAGRFFSIPTVKDLPGHFVNYVVGLDTKRSLSGYLAKRLD
jgi:hypothetical protein